MDSGQLATFFSWTASRSFHFRTHIAPRMGPRTSPDCSPLTPLSCYAPSPPPATRHTPAHLDAPRCHRSLVRTALHCFHATHAVCSASHCHLYHRRSVYLLALWLPSCTIRIRFTSTVRSRSGSYTVTRTFLFCFRIFVAPTFKQRSHILPTHSPPAPSPPPTIPRFALSRLQTGSGL